MGIGDQKNLWHDGMKPWRCLDGLGRQPTDVVDSQKARRGDFSTFWGFSWTRPSSKLMNGLVLEDANE